MNVIFHTTTAIGVAALLTDTSRLGNKPTLNQVIPTALCSFLVGVVSHGALDFIPHCYPINSSADVIAGLVMILSITWKANPPFRAIIGLAFLGTIFPDIVDHGPKMINRYFNLGMTIPENIFPWHWHEYTGSIYDGVCNVSTINHLILVFTLGVVLWTRRTDLEKVFKRS
jgi:hypothetical protein